MKIFCDSSTREACIVVEGQEPKIFVYHAQVTNNVGEYRAVILALLESPRYLPEIFTDSQLVVNQVNGHWKVRQKHLLPLRDRVRELLAAFSGTLTWIPREENPAGRVLE